jgi:hypothetical protein
MDIFKKQNEMADKILTKKRGKVLAIVKATRAGATFSLLKRACELKQKTTIVAPYINIFDETVNDVIKSFTSGTKPNYIRIAANKDMCKKVQEKIATHPNLRKFPFHKRPTCKNCEHNDPSRCLLQEALSCDDWDVIGITYAKLKYLCYGNSEIARAFLEKLKLIS